MKACRSSSVHEMYRKGFRVDVLDRLGVPHEPPKTSPLIYIYIYTVVVLVVALLGNSKKEATHRTPAADIACCVASIESSWGMLCWDWPRGFLASMRGEHA